MNNDEVVVILMDGSERSLRPGQLLVGLTIVRVVQTGSECQPRWLHQLSVRFNDPEAGTQWLRSVVTPVDRFISKFREVWTQYQQAEERIEKLWVMLDDLKGRSEPDHFPVAIELYRHNAGHTIRIAAPKVIPLLEAELAEMGATKRAAAERLLALQGSVTVNNIVNG